MLDTGVLARCGLDAVAAAAAILEGGAGILQLRHKGHFSREIYACAERMAQLCSAAGVMFVVNDRADLALMLGAALHVGQDDLPPSAARRVLGDSGLIGFSTHNEAQLRAAADEPVDYLAIGPMFTTSSKENPNPVVGVEALCRLRSLTERPLVAIGGITRANAAAVLAAGADSVAVIGDLFTQRATAATLRARTEEWIAIAAEPVHPR